MSITFGSRRYIQANNRPNSKFEMMKTPSGYPTLEEWILDNLNDGDSLE